MPYLTNLAAIARSTGLPVVEQLGWQTRGHGGMIGVKTIVAHHTAGPATGNAPSLSVVQNGRPDLSGPLAHFVLGRDGTVFVVAAGQCWHTGATWKTDQSNAYAIGIEAEATGTSSWPEVQLDAYARLCRALCTAFGLGVDRVQGHKEICSPTGRKTDPNFDMGAFRGRVAHPAGGDSTGTTTTPDEEEDEDMSSDSGPATTGDDWGVLHVPVNGHRYLRIATSYGHQATIGMTMIDDTPSAGAPTKAPVSGGVVDPDRPGPWDLSKAHPNYANFSHIVIQYQCAGPIKAWTNDRP